jgi:multisubunit Na+/H+ antiporter MnhC subunit
VPNIAEPVSFGFVLTSIAVIFAIIALGVIGVKKGKKSKEK